jgi:preprotein translocase subunit YajC
MIYSLLDAATTTTSTTTTTTASWADMIPTIIMMVAMIAVFYFLLIRPQRKKDKAVKDMLAALKPGDRICTIGGIYGTIASIKDDTITLYVGAQKFQMVVARWAIRSVEDAPLVENESEALV